ncbi:hypothetical protein TcCL_NonESM09553 [Trypanosoma cruzi]|nr:hypothetical protein TcCL_NonESM09553 [Trypanosoma cruzi]
MLSVCTANNIGNDTEEDCPIILLPLTTDPPHPPPRHALGAAKRRQAKPLVWKSPMRGARLAATHTHSPTNTLSYNLPTHKRAKTWRKEARRTTHAEAAPSTSHLNEASCAQHTHGRNKRGGRTQVHGAVLYFPPPNGLGLRPTAGCGGWRPTLTVRHSAHHLLPSKCTQRAGARRPVILVPLQRRTQKIAAAGHQCL